jgi:hypothetical protein
MGLFIEVFFTAIVLNEFLEGKLTLIVSKAVEKIP